LESRYCVNDSCNKGFADLKQVLDSKQYPYALICVPGCSGEDIIIIKNGERLESDTNPKIVLSDVMSDREPITYLRSSEEICAHTITEAVKQLDSAIIYWEEMTSRKYTLILVIKIGKSWRVYTSQNGKSWIIPRENTWEMTLDFGLKCRAKNM
jgi:hypothetical protein